MIVKMAAFVRLPVLAYDKTGNLIGETDRSIIFKAVKVQCLGEREFIFECTEGCRGAGIEPFILGPGESIPDEVIEQMTLHAQTCEALFPATPSPDSGPESSPETSLTPLLPTHSAAENTSQDPDFGPLRPY